MEDLDCVDEDVAIEAELGGLETGVAGTGVGEDGEDVGDLGEEPGGFAVSAGVADGGGEVVGGGFDVRFYDVVGYDFAEFVEGGGLPVGEEDFLEAGGGAVAEVFIGLLSGCFSIFGFGDEHG